MTSRLDELVAFLRSYAREHPGESKPELAGATATRFNLSKDRSVYHCGDFAIRFSIASGPSFSNTVSSLAAVHKYDHLPFIVCVIRPSAIELVLANATFLKKISHSSHRLRVDNVRGSFLGHDIVREYAELSNAPENFEALFGMHLEFSWEENLARLVEATNAITSSAVRFEPSPEQTANVMRSAELAAWLTTQAEYEQLGVELNDLVESSKEEILAAASIDNVKQRGDAIERLLTRASQVNNLEDLSRTLEIGPRVAIDIKTKILALVSSPKAYNIEKFLRTLASGSTVFDFFFVGIDVADRRLHTCLVSGLHRTILAATRVQFHWAGRNTRGVTQRTGDLSRLFLPGFVEEIDVPQAQQFLDRLIALPA